MIWSIDLDDFNGVCSDTTYPLTRLVSNNLQSMDRKKCMPLARITDSDIDAYLSKVYKWVPSSNELVEESIEKLRTFNINASHIQWAQQQQQQQLQQQQQQQFNQPAYQKQLVIGGGSSLPGGTTRRLGVPLFTNPMELLSSTVAAAVPASTPKYTMMTSMSSLLSSQKPSKSPIYDIDYRYNVKLWLTCLDFCLFIYSLIIRMTTI